MADRPSTSATSTLLGLVAGIICVLSVSRIIGRRSVRLRRGVSLVRRTTQVRAHRFAMPVGTQRVYLTREKGKNGKLRKRLEEQGVSTVELPCIQAKQLEGGTTLSERLNGSEEWEWTIVTSPEGAKILVSAWEKAGRPEIQAAAVGGGTAKILINAGINDVFVPSKANGKTLAEELPKPEGTKRVLYPVSKRASEEVQTLLGKRGYTVERIDSYTTLDADWTAEDEKLASEARIVTFGSPSAVRVWADRAPIDTIIAVCIGGTSANACEKYGFQKIIHPTKPGVDTWAEEVFKVLKSIDLDQEAKA
ncbi:hypothetical protein AAMO2058_000999600 [Amorphochlora amoebiformis]